MENTIYIKEEEVIRIEGTSAIECPECELGEGYNISTSDGHEYPKSIYLCSDCDKIIRVE